MNIKFISLKTLVKHLIVASFIVVLMWESGISFCINEARVCLNDFLF